MNLTRKEERAFLKIVDWEGVILEVDEGLMSLLEMLSQSGLSRLTHNQLLGLWMAKNMECEESSRGWRIKYHGAPDGA
jgi:hypothetical protein